MPPPLPHPLTCIHARAALRKAFNIPSSQAIAQRRTKGTSAIICRLRKDTPRYGRAGAFVRVARGQLRNDFYPKRIADYVPEVELRALRRAGTPVDRDLSFMADAVVMKGNAATVLRRGKLGEATSRSAGTREAGWLAVPVAAAAAATLEVLEPERVRAAIEMGLPAVLEFRRTCIVGDEDAGGDRAKAIYGSVSTADVAASVKAAVGANGGTDGGAVSGMLEVEDVKFVGLGEGVDRVKTLGDFEFEIRVKGLDGGLRRTVRVAELV